MDKLYSLTATQMKDLLDKKEVTSVEITKSVIENIERTDKDIIDMPHTEKIVYVERIYEDEFVKPMTQVLESAFGDARAKNVMEVELWTC